MRPRRGFKALELLVVLVMGITSFGLFCGCAMRAEVIRDNVDTKANLRNIVIACRTAEVEFTRLPPIYGVYGRPPQPGVAPRIATVFVHLLPYLEQAQLHREGNFAGATVKIFLSNLDDSIKENQARYTSFAANLRVFSAVGAAQPWNQTVDAPMCREGHLSTNNILDGAGQTVFFATKYGVCNGTPNYFDYSPERNRKAAPFFGAGNHQHGGIPTRHIATGRLHNVPPFQVNPLPLGSGSEACNDDLGLFGHSFGSSGLLVGMGDTAVRNLSFSLSGDTWGKALCPNDGNPLGMDW